MQENKSFFSSEHSINYGHLRDATEDKIQQKLESWLVASYLDIRVIRDEPPLHHRRQRRPWGCNCRRSEV